MPTEPKREQLIAAVASRLAQIVAGGESDYWFTPGEVARDWKNYDEVTSFPCYGVIEGGSQGRRDTHGHGVPTHRETLTVTVIGWINGDTMQVARRTAVNRAIADVTRAIERDVRWGGLAIMTDPPSVITDEAALIAAPFAYFELTCTIHYARDHGAA